LQENLIFVIGPPRSGSTLLQRMLGSHSAIQTHPEPHIITPLAHLGYFATVDRAPYDHINAAEAIREFVADLPAGESDYLDACRAYTDVLYGRMHAASGAQMFLDKTPAYALVLPFLAKLYPRARFVVLTRHPLAVLSSYANSFFEGDWQAAQAFNPILERYLPAMAEFLRQDTVVHHHLRYEDLVTEPESQLAAIFDFLGLPNEEAAVNYGEHEHADKSYGDPKVRHHKRPTTASLTRWAADLAGDPEKLELARRTVAPLDQKDVASWGYDAKALFDPVNEARGAIPKRDLRWMLDSYRLKRRMFLALRKDIHTNRLGRTLKRVRYYCDVLLRE
jgi:hypothetical protein